ncbi:MAG: hypothetical protein MN733_03385 [Nitrososphaera sp.]|nr:hypothetical protein [Nitrososphaera sp.]
MTNLIRITQYGIKLSKSGYYLTTHRLWQNPIDNPNNLCSVLLFRNLEQAEKEIKWFRSKGWTEWMEPFRVELEFEATELKRWWDKEQKK